MKDGPLVNQQSSAADRRVYRNRGLMRASLLATGLAAAVIAGPIVTGPDDSPADAFGVALVATLMAAVMLWIGFRPRTVVRPEHLMFSSFVTCRKVAWADIQAVTVGRDAKAGTDGISVTIADTDVRLPVPGINSFGLGRAYMQRAAADIEATWRAVTEASGPHIGD